MWLFQVARAPEPVIPKPPTDPYLVNWLKERMPNCPIAVVEALAGEKDEAVRESKLVSVDEGARQMYQALRSRKITRATYDLLLSQNGARHFVDNPKQFVQQA
ncbi:MAG: hypothetical protein KGH63_02190, partial [Candidatus Micrarchaeota archaeon]|nr:hypothetical protein [Candidatus Micrarchaeota archaeon]